jgi:hypothetical protein
MPTPKQAFVFFVIYFKKAAPPLSVIFAVASIRSPCFLLLLLLLRAAGLPFFASAVGRARGSALLF